jgi:hypothetical protein
VKRAPPPGAVVETVDGMLRLLDSNRCSLCVEAARAEPVSDHASLGLDVALAATGAGMSYAGRVPHLWQIPSVSSAAGAAVVSAC